jgi:hypothetical protein
MHSISVLAAFLIMALPEVEGPYIHGNLAVYVVRGPQADVRSYITLDEGLKSGAVKVRERGSGDVNTLEVENGSDDYLFLHVGDVIRGGKQDRTIATDVVLPPRSTPVTIDAFCVEPGRWAADAASGMEFSLNEAMVSGAALKRTIQADMSQMAVWSEVAETEALAASYVEAPLERLSVSGTYSAIVDNETLKAKRADYVETLLPRVTAHDDAIGVVAAIDGVLVGADVYGSHELFQKLVRKLLDSYAQESILAGESPSGAALRLADVKRFLADGDSFQTELISKTMERRSSENVDAAIFEYRVTGDARPLHSSYVKKK